MKSRGLVGQDQTLPGAGGAGSGLAMLEQARAHMPNGVPMAWMAAGNGPPVYVDRGTGAAFTDLDGFSYLDFNVSDMAMFCGHANPSIVAAVQAQVARSTQFLLPTPDSVAVAEELARRCLREELGLPVPPARFPLDEIGHPLLRKAAEQFAAGDTPHQRIRAIDDGSPRLT
jgi:hypothetical protein